MWKKKEQKEDVVSKMSTNYLVYGSRLDFLEGIEDTLGKPLLTMKEEFNRNISWNDKQSNGLCHSQTEWENANVKLDDFMNRKENKVAKLNENEILALHLYTGPSYLPINNFLRGLGDKKQRSTLLSKETTWAQTVYYIYQGFLKLSLLEKTYPTTYRGCDMPLSPEFFIPDERGMIAATEFGFMSTSLKQEVAHIFAGEKGGGTLFQVKCHRRDAVGYHMGASLEWLTAFPGEHEILFPPFTLFQVIKRERDLKNMTIITVIPTYVRT